IRNSLSTPVTGAGTSSTTLSVSRSARFSSRVTAWPTCLCQVTSVASATDSGSCGTLISMDMSFLLVLLSRRGRCGRHRRSHEAFGFARPVFFVGGAQGRLDEAALFRFVHLADASGRRRGRSAACVQQFTLADERREPMADLIPRALVLRLFLAPHHFARVRVFREHGLHLRNR